MNIPMPGPEEKKMAVSRIVDAGVPAVRRENLFCMVRALTPRILFFGVGDCLLVSFLFLAFAGTAFLMSAQSNLNGSGVLLLFLSPALYLLLYSLTMLKEFSENTREIPCSCHYNIRHLTTMRMLYFGGFGTAANAVISFLGAGWSGSFVRLLGVSLSVLFLYASVSTFCLLHLRRAVLQLVMPPALFAGAAVLMILFWPDFSSFLLNVLPAGVSLLTAGCFCAIFLAEVYRYYKKGKGKTHYAFG